MIQEKLRDKDKDLKGMKKALGEMLDRSWEKGYIAGFNDGYATRREADIDNITDLLETEWGTDKLSIDADGNIRDFNGRVLFIHPTYNMDEYGDSEVDNDKTN